MTAKMSVFIYAHYAAIVQSSGMGKSRTVDELGKAFFHTDQSQECRIYR
jgi:hypothetical protein